MALGSTISQITKSGLKPGLEFPSLVLSGILTATTVSPGGSITASNKFYGDGSKLTGLQLSKELTIGVRVGAAVTFTVTGSSFNVLNRSGGNVPISI